jgi:predicted DNA-binding protein
METTKNTGRVGRPRTGTPILVRIPVDMLTAIDHLAAEHGRTRAEEIRELLTYALWVA